MIERPLVSVIVPFFNPGRFLDEAIRSVFEQRYTRWELLLVNDGSSDGSGEIAQRYAEQHPQRVRTLEHPGRRNLGLSASRNLGIRDAGGDLVAFLDADDVWLPHKLQHQVDIMRRHADVELVCGPSLYWHSWVGSDDGATDRVVPVGAPQDAVIDPPTLLVQLYPLGEGAAPCPTSLLVRRQLFERVGAFEEDFRVVYEDQAFLAKVYLNARVFVSSLCCDYYRQHSDSVSSNFLRSGQYHTVRSHYLHWLEAFLKKNDCHIPEVRDALQRALLPYRRPVAWFLAEMRSRPGEQLKRLASAMMRRALPRPAHIWLRGNLRRARHRSSR